jgi:nitrogen fixation/metabolism regulation signal transduction histidine kinase
MSFSSCSSLIGSESSDIPTVDQYPIVLSSIQQKISVIKSSISSIQTQTKEKRLELHSNLKSANELAKKMKISILRLDNPDTKLLYQKWKRKLDKEFVDINKFAKQLISAEDYIVENKEYSEEDTLLSPQQQSLGFEMDLQSEILQEREEKINRITSTIYTVNTMLKDLSEMVCEQSYLIDNVETNIEDSAEKSKKAVAELNKSEKDNKSSRQRQCMIILLVVLLLLVISIIGTTYYRHILEI